MDLDFMAHQALLRNNTLPLRPIAFFVGTLFSITLWLGSCTSLSTGNSATDLNKIYTNTTDSALKFVNGVAYKSDKLYTGNVLQLYPTGDTQMVSTYQNGNLHGSVIGYYPGHQLSEKRWYINGQKHGVHRGWWPNGNLKFEYHFNNADNDGVQQQWFGNGTPFSRMNYRKGVQEGPQRMWWANGDVRANYVIKNGERYGLLGQMLCEPLPTDSSLKP